MKANELITPGRVLITIAISTSGVILFDGWVSDLFILLIEGFFLLPIFIILSLFIVSLFKK